MKKALHFVITACLFTTVSNAQIAKSKVLLGGTLAYYQRTEDYSDERFNPAKQRYLTVSPSVGKVIKENLVLGVEVSFMSSYLRYNPPLTINENKSKSYGGAIFLRRYVPLLKNFYFFGQAAAGFSKQKGAQTYDSKPYNETNGWGSALSLTPGLTYGITKKFFVEAALNNLALLAYSHSKTESTDATTQIVSSSKSNDFNVSTSLGSSGGFNIGFRLLL